MSVRKRQWFTGKQIAAYAERCAMDTKAAGKALNDLLKAARNKDPIAAAELETLAEGKVNEAWIVDYVDQRGERHIETFEKKKDADAYHATVRVDVAKGTHTAPSKSLTIAEAAEIWINRVEADGRERTTIRQYRQHINLHIVPRLGRIKLAQLNVRACEQFRDDLLGALSRPLARKVLTSFKSMLKSNGYQHVAAGVTIARDKRSERRLEIGRDIPDPKEIKRIVAAVTDARDQALLMTVIGTGLRASELRGLRWSDVDLNHRELTVRQRADRFNRIGAPKTEASVRTIPIPAPTVAALKTWKVACPPNPQDLVFPTSTGAIEHHSNMLRSLNSVLVTASVVDSDGRAKYALHAFRHFFASWCLNPTERGGLGMGADPKGLQTLLGHSSITMTFDIYGHLFPATGDRNRIDTAAAALFGNAT